jgi:hypothetical protein
MIFNSSFNFIYSGDCQRIFLLMACMCLFLNGSIMSPYSTFISYVLADSEDNKDSKDNEVSSDSNAQKKSSERNSDNEDNGSSEKSDEQDDPPKQDESSKEEEPPTDQEQDPPQGEEPKEEPPEEEPPEEEPPEEEPSEEEPPNVEPQPPIIITNTVTAPTVSSPSSDEDDDDDENEGPTKFAFIDSFFTDQTAKGSVIAGTSSDSSATQDIPPVIKQEVGPGEGYSMLAIVLINRGFSDVTSIRASLDFPAGFSSNVTPKNIDNDTSLASYNGLVEAGQTFTLYFPVNISKDTQVGKEYTASLNIDY